MADLDGWVWIYLIGSLPIALFYAAGLAGWLLNYHLGLVAAIFTVLGVPLVLLIVEVSSAPAWNIAALWLGAGSISLRIGAGARSAERERLRSSAGTLVGIVVVATAWALVWTVYFLNSEHIASTFG